MNLDYRSRKHPLSLSVYYLLDCCANNMKSESESARTTARNTTCANNVSLNSDLSDDKRTQSQTQDQDGNTASSATFTTEHDRLFQLNHILTKVDLNLNLNKYVV